MSQFDCSWRRHQAIKPTRYLRTSSRPKKQWQIEQNSNHTTKIIRLMMKLERGWLKNGPITKFGWCSFSSWLNFLHPGKTKRENAAVLLHSTRKWAQSELVTLWRLSLHVGCLRRRLSSELLWFDSRLQSLSCCATDVKKSQNPETPCSLRIWTTTHTVFAWKKSNFCSTRINYLRLGSLLWIENRLRRSIL